MKQSMRNAGIATADRFKVVRSKTAGVVGQDEGTKDIDIAVVKATTARFHIPPKEKHVTTLKMALHPSGSRHYQGHIISMLVARIHSATDWLTALKTLITIHRLMRETDPSFLTNLCRAQSAPDSNTILGVENYLDSGTATPGKFDYSEWVRAYGRYLEEQLSAAKSIGWTIESEGGTGESKLRNLPPRELLIQLPSLQRLLRRLTDCVPRGQAATDPVVLFSLSLILKESFRIYKATSEGIINLASVFFELDVVEATKGLDAYKESVAGNAALSDYYDHVQSIEEIRRSMQLPRLASPPADFIESMEVYVRDEAPQTVVNNNSSEMVVQSSSISGSPLHPQRQAPPPPPPLAGGATTTTATTTSSSSDMLLAKKGGGLPLRKGRALSRKLSSSEATATSTSMALAVLPVQPTVDQERDQQEGDQQEEEETEPPQQQQPATVLDLLSFDALTVTDDNQQQHTNDVIPQPPPPPPPPPPAAAVDSTQPMSALDLLGELDFSVSHAPSGGGGTTGNGGNPFGSPSPAEYGGGGGGGGGTPPLSPTLRRTPAAGSPVDLFKAAGTHDPFASIVKPHGK
jgi:hypothetical protein